MINNIETAQTAPVEQYQYYGSLSPYFYSLRSDVTNNHFTFLPCTEFMVKSGINDKCDFGIGLQTIYFAPVLILNSKYQFLKSKMDGAVSLEVAWFPGFIFEMNSGTFSLKPTLFFSQEKAHRFPFRIAFGTYLWPYWDYDENGFNPSLIANIGFPIRFGQNRKFRLMPDLGFLYDFKTNMTVQCGLSFSNVGEDNE